jgi:hypothetical protein
VAAYKNEWPASEWLTRGEKTEDEGRREREKERPATEPVTRQHVNSVTLPLKPDSGSKCHTEEGPVLSAHVDAAYGVHTDARSHTGYYLSIGRYSAPVYTYSGSQTSCISLGSMKAEHVAMGEVAKKILEYRYLLSDLGFELEGPTVIYEDNKSAINLANAPAITRKSRHTH